MDAAEIERFLGTTGLGVLAMAAKGDAYALLFLYGRDEKRFYFHSRPA